MLFSRCIRALRRAAAVSGIALTATGLSAGAGPAAWAAAAPSAPSASGGSALAWGFNMWGQVGDGTDVDRDTPVRVCAPAERSPCTRFLGHAAAVSGGGIFSLALDQDSSVLGWGGQHLRPAR